MKIHKAKLIQPSDKLMVRVWDSEKPNNERDKYIAEPHHAGYSRHDWNVKVWLQSYKDFEVHPDYVERFENIAWALQIPIALNENQFNSDLKQGIDLDPDLIDFEELIDAEKEIKEGVFWNPITYAILKDKPV